MSPKENIITLLNLRIEKEKKSSFLNHMLSERYTTYGSVEKDKFSVWQKSGWTGAFYYVINGSMKEQNGRLKIDVRPRLNYFGQLIAYSLLGFIIYGLVAGVVLQGGMEFTYLWKRIAVAALILIIPIGAFRLVYRFEMKEKLKEIKGVLKTGLKTVTLENAIEHFDTDHYISVVISDLDRLIRSLGKLAKVYPNVQYPRSIVVFKSTISDSQYYVSFPNQPDFERFMYFTNFLEYPDAGRTKGEIRGYWWVKSEDYIKGFDGQRAMLFVPEGDDEFDNVYVAFDKSDINAKIGFGYYQRMKRLKSPIEKFNERIPDKEELELVEIVNPLP